MEAGQRNSLEHLFRGFSQSMSDLPYLKMKFNELSDLPDLKVKYNESSPVGKIINDFWAINPSSQVLTTDGSTHQAQGLSKPFSPPTENH